MTEAERLADQNTKMAALNRIMGNPELAKTQEDTAALLRKQAEALEQSMVALDDWIITYAHEFCNDKDVKAAWDRISKGGGTLAYVANINEQNRNALNGGK